MTGFHVILLRETLIKFKKNKCRFLDFALGMTELSLIRASLDLILTVDAVLLQSQL